MKLLTFGILCVTITQAYPSPKDIADEETAKPCDDKLSSYYDKVVDLKKSFDDEYETWNLTGVDALIQSDLQLEHDKLERKFADSLNRYARKSKRSIPADHKQRASCQKETRQYQSSLLNFLESLAQIALISKNISQQLTPGAPPRASDPNLQAAYTFFPLPF